VSFKTRMETLWDTPTTDLGADSEPGNGGEHSEVADWQGTRNQRPTKSGKKKKKKIKDFVTLNSNLKYIIKHQLRIK